jgi:putative serine protease PepD
VTSDPHSETTGPITTGPGTTGPIGPEPTIPISQGAHPGPAADVPPEWRRPGTQWTEPYPPGTHQVPGGYSPPPMPPVTGVLPHHTAPAPVAQRRSTLKPIIATALIAGLFGGAVALGGATLIDHTTTATPQLGTAATAPAQPSQPGSVTYAAAAASKFTADIAVATAQGTAIGSGIVLSSDGYVLTNNHVVNGVGSGARIQVTTADQNTNAATIVGTSPSYDLAVIKLQNVSGLTAAPLGSSANLQVGEQVVAVGSPESLSNTVTSGIISALSRTVTAGDEQGSQVTVYNGLQTDTPINPGNSVGPLVNLSGQVIGVNSAVDTGQSSQGGVQAFGLGFAIPIDTARRVANELLQDGKATKPVLGVTGSISDTQNAAAGGVTGAQVTGVTRDGAAAAAGIGAGDVITKVGDEKVDSYADLMAQVLTHTPGEAVPVTVSGSGGERTVSVTLGSAVDTEQTTVPGNGTP